MDKATCDKLLNPLEIMEARSNIPRNDLPERENDPLIKNPVVENESLFEPESFKIKELESYVFCAPYISPVEQTSSGMPELYEDALSEYFTESYIRECNDGSLAERSDAWENVGALETIAAEHSYSKSIQMPLPSDNIAFFPTEPVEAPHWWSDWKRELNDWLEPQSGNVERFSARPRCLQDVEDFYGEQDGTEEFAEMNEYFKNWCKYYTNIYLKSIASDNWHRKCFDVLDPLSAFEDYGLTHVVSTNNSLLATRDGRLAFENGDMERAIVHFENALKGNPNSPDSWYLLGRAQAAAGNDNQAVSAWKMCLALEFSRAEVYLALASSLINEGLFSYACRMLCCWLCLRQGTQQETAYQKISEQKFGFFDLHKMPTSFVDEQDLQNLLDIFLDIEKGIANTKSEGVKNENNEEDVDAKSSEVKDSKKYGGQSVECPVDADFNTCLALLYIMSNKLPEAGSSLSAAIQSRNEDPILWNMLGAVLVEEKDYGGAIESFKNALSIWPGYARVRLNIASLCLKIGLHREAAQHLLQVILQRGKDGPYDVTLWHKLRSIIAGMTNINQPLLEKAWARRDVNSLKSLLL